MSKRESPSEKMRQALVDYLAHLGMLGVPAPSRAQRPPGGASAELWALLLRVCHEGLLAGGMSVALGVRADELIGPLTHRMGGAATRLRVHDVRGERPMQLEVHYQGTTEKWEVEDLEGLIHNLNDLYRSEPGVKAVMVLGEWEDMLQLWAVPKPTLARLLREPFVRARNQRQLEELAEGV